MSVYALTDQRTQVDTSGQLIISNDLAYGAFYAFAALFFFGFWVLAVSCQVVSCGARSGNGGSSSAG